MGESEETEYEIGDTIITFEDDSEYAVSRLRVDEFLPEGEKGHWNWKPIRQLKPGMSVTINSLDDGHVSGVVSSVTKVKMDKALQGELDADVLRLIQKKPRDLNSLDVMLGHKYNLLTQQPIKAALKRLMRAGKISKRIDTRYDNQAYRSNLKMKRRSAVYTAESKGGVTMNNIDKTISHLLGENNVNEMLLSQTIVVTDVTDMEKLKEIGEDEGMSDVKITGNTYKASNSDKEGFKDFKMAAKHLGNIESTKNHWW